MHKGCMCRARKKERNERKKEITSSACRYFFSFFLSFLSYFSFLSFCEKGQHRGQDEVGGKHAQTGCKQCKRVVAAALLAWYPFGVTQHSAELGPVVRLTEGHHCDEPPIVTAQVHPRHHVFVVEIGALRAPAPAQAQAQTQT